MNQDKGARLQMRQKGRRRSVVEDGPHEVDLFVGERIRFYRVMRGIAQTKLGKDVGVTFQQMQKYERGDNRVSCSRLHQISTVLGVPIGAFFPSEGGEGQDGLQQLEQSKVAIDRKTLNLVRFYGNIEDEGTRDRIYELLKELSKTKEEL
ncbi:MAG: helix-turn-helix domain-containing protein [Porticoccaceae bacterium]